MESKLGKAVLFATVDADGQLVMGTGVAVAVFLSADHFIQYRVIDMLDQKKTYTIDRIMIDPSKEAAEVYAEHVRKIRAKADEINAHNKTLVEQGNAEIMAMNVSLLGEPLKLEFGVNDNTESHVP